MGEFSRADFNAEISEKMDALRSTNIDLSGNDPDSKVFCYTVADMFDTLEEGRFVYTDGPKDLGIDFYVRDGDDFRIYQCKSIDLENYPNGKVFDATPVNELAEAIEYLVMGNRTASASIQKLRGAYQLNKNEHTLSATLAIEGRLSQSAKERFEEIKHQYRDQSIEVTLIDEISLYSKWHSFDDLIKPQKIAIKLDVINNGLMRMKGWFCAAVSIGSLLDAMGRYGNALFDSNVRSKLHNSRINADIKKTISTPKGRKQFIHLNNGMVITCSNYTISDDQTTISLQGAQVVNGCQTLTTIREYYEGADESTQYDILESLNLLVKVISSAELNKGNLLDEIIVASNNQNPMNARNLKSNSLEQRRLQESFARDPLRKDLRFFYIRKDGELEAFLDSPHNKRTPKKSDFEISGTTRRGKNRYRHIDNEDLGKRWLSWMGNSPVVNSGAVKIFSDEKIYSDIFEHRPSLEFWKQESKPDFTYSRKNLEEMAPTQFQLLVAWAFSTYLQAKIKPDNSAQFKRSRIEVLKSSGKISDTPGEKEITEALSHDSEYLNTIWMNQMSFGLTEIAAFVLLQRYSDLQSDTCRKLLDHADVAFWLAHGIDKKSLNEPAMEKGVLEKTYEFLSYATKNFFDEKRSTILLENRPKLYLGKRDTIAAIKLKFLELNESVRDYPYAGMKDPGQTFLEALPNL